MLSTSAEMDLTSADVTMNDITSADGTQGSPGVVQIDNLSEGTVASYFNNYLI